MRLRLLAVLTALASLLMVCAGPASAQSYPSAASWDWQRVDQIRGSHGLRPVYDNSTLNWYAQVWADYMALHDVLAHGMLPTNLSGWTTLGQNVGYSTAGPNYVEWAFEHDWAHLSNILGRHYNKIGVGVAYGHGRWWVVQDYWG